MTQIPSGKTEAEQKIVLAKRNLEKLSIEFHKLLDDKKLMQNKTNGEKSMEADLALRLIQAANDLDVANYPELEGIYSLIMLLTHIGLIMRDRYNQIEYGNESLLREINKLKKQIADLSSAGQRSG